MVVFGEQTQRADIIVQVQVGIYVMGGQIVLYEVVGIDIPLLVTDDG